MAWRRISGLGSSVDLPRKASAVAGSFLRISSRAQARAMRPPLRSSRNSSNSRAGMRSLPAFSTMASRAGRNQLADTGSSSSMAPNAGTKAAGPWPTNSRHALAAWAFPFPPGPVPRKAAIDVATSARAKPTAQARVRQAFHSILIIASPWSLTSLQPSDGKDSHGEWFPSKGPAKLLEIFTKPSCELLLLFVV